MDKQLTRAEEQIMQYLWKLQKGSVKEILGEFEEPKPKTTTISTIVRVLETKGFVGHEPKGRGFLYFPLIAQEDYSSSSVQKVIQNYFDGSFKSMVSFFAKKKDISVSELESIINEINKEDE